MKLNYTTSAQRLEKVLLAAALFLGAGAANLASVPAQAQMPRIVVQCVAPLVPNADGTDCVRPAAGHRSCPRLMAPEQGRCSQPTIVFRFVDCDHRTRGEFGVTRNFDLAFYPEKFGMIWNSNSNTGKRRSWDESHRIRRVIVTSGNGPPRRCERR